jgi:guanylate kinase
MMREGIIFIISGPSGGGKTSLTTRVMAELDNLRFSVSYTTREPREGEVDGKDYRFVSESEFNDMVRENKFAEYANVYGNLYGTPLDQFETANKTGVDLILDIDVQGAKQIREKYSRGIFCFVTPSSFEELRARLTRRGTEGDPEIERPISVARKEMEEMGHYDYIIHNDDLDEAVCTLKGIIKSKRQEQRRVS